MLNKVDLSYGGLFRLAVTLISVAMVIYHVWAIAFGSPEAFYYRGTHLAFAITLVFLLHRKSGAVEGLPTALDYVLLVLSLAPIAYLFANYDYFINRMFYVDELSWADMIMGILMTVMVLEGTRRVIGLALPITAVVFLVYGLFIARLTPQGMGDDIGVTFHPGAAKDYKDVGLSVKNHCSVRAGGSRGLQPARIQGKLKKMRCGGPC
jgi:TRAP-type uncharacterized transport system fused permease subunit